MYSIEVSSDFSELWRYNIFATCGGFDSAGGSLYVVGKEMISSEEIQTDIIPLPAPPDSFDPKSMTITLEAEAAASIKIIVYVVAHTLPESRIVEDSPPFNTLITVQRDGKEIYRDIHKVNQWGGMTANIKI